MSLKRLEEELKRIESKWQKEIVVKVGDVDVAFRVPPVTELSPILKRLPSKLFSMAAGEVDFSSSVDLLGVAGDDKILTFLAGLVTRIGDVDFSGVVTIKDKPREEVLKNYIKRFSPLAIIQILVQIVSVAFANMTKSASEFQFPGAQDLLKGLAEVAAEAGEEIGRRAKETLEEAAESGESPGTAVQ